ncbi:hypothetical protein TNCT_415751 [Trichonephila clavata]|uniref:Uncharacterized protein n=1 Tax=Trichonephila clavata TaxID=2740835 RepID=A0A8X6GZX2_TRICU|nr:hypothetical protein TNCT_415751 [Trichonephila clavata]
MEVDPPDPTLNCKKRSDLMLIVETSEILSSNLMPFLKRPDTEQNMPLKEVVRNQIKEHQQGKDAALAELDSLPLCVIPNCGSCATNKFTPSTSSTMIEETTAKIATNDGKALKINEDNPQLKRKTKKKRKKTKDVTDDFVFPKRTARPTSPTPSEPIATANSFSDLESDIEVDDQQQETPQEPSIPMPISPIFLKIKPTIRDQLKAIYTNFPETTNKQSGVSFANIVSGTNPTPPNPRNEKTPTEENKVVREPRVNENVSDLVQVLELIQLISNIIKRSPDILNLIPKLKQADKDDKAAYVLLEALLDKK